MTRSLTRSFHALRFIYFPRNSQLVMRIASNICGALIPMSVVLAPALLSPGTAACSDTTSVIKYRQTETNERPPPFIEVNLTQAGRQITYQYNDWQANEIGKVVNDGFEFCRMEFSRSIILDDKLWIDSGTTWLSRGHTGIFQDTEINGYLLWIDLTKPFSRDNYTLNAVKKPLGDPRVGRLDAPSVEQGEIFLWEKEPNKFFVYGGFFPGFNKSSTSYWKPEPNPRGEIYSYDILSNIWARVDLNSDSDIIIWSMEGGSTYAPSTGQFFYLGGYEDAWANSALPGDGKMAPRDNKARRPFHVVPGFLRLEMEAEGGSKWTNETMTYEGGAVEHNQIVRGQLIYVPVGKQGILVRIGGETYTTGMGDELNRTPSLNRMDLIYIYDIATSVWYIQGSTGPTGAGVPKGRQQFCLSLAVAPDNSSYNIIMFGGGQTNRWDGYGDVWILSLPAFVWVQAYVGTNLTVGASCRLYKGRQMLITGARRTDDRNCHELWKIYDVVDGKWREEFDPNLEGFEVPQILTAEIGGQ
ncbi:hypothetical protein BDZ91DRAFT_710317 [Kalaharituber pfeilii]|nr:hypothetical protein BDZ91DRAFT_710317 [Kalaharituber pfeilii]